MTLFQKSCLIFIYCNYFKLFSIFQASREGYLFFVRMVPQMLFVYLKKCITFPMRNTVRRKPEGMQQRLSRIGMVDARYNNSKLNLAYITSKTSIFSLKNERKLKSVGNLVVLSMLSKPLIFEQDTSKNRRKTKFYQTLSKCF